MTSSRVIECDLVRKHKSDGLGRLLCSAVSQWMVIVIIALVLSGANIYGYTKCNADAKNKVRPVPANTCNKNKRHLRGC